MASACLDDNDVAELLSGTLPAEQLGRFEQHLASCDTCRAEVGDLAELASQPRVSGALDAEAAGPLPEASQLADVRITELDTIREPDRFEGSALSAAELSAGDRIDHFEVRALLGRGGMGEVYLAEDTKLGRTVALKVVRPELLASAEARVRFEREARTTARFSHPNIVTIHAVGEDAGRPYVALEHLVGETLQARLAEGPLQAAEVQRVALAVAEALAVAHEHGVLHRDLKPANVHLGEDGGVRVLDFGLAKAIDQEVRALETSAGDEPLTAPAATTTGGTPAYMAPEQWRAEASQPATDIWALGVVMYRALSGRLPFEQPTLSALREAVVGPAPAPRLSEATEEPSAWWDALLARCLDKDPARRPETEELVASLRRGPPAPRRRWPLLLVAAVLLAVVVLLAGPMAQTPLQAQPLLEPSHPWLTMNDRLVPEAASAIAPRPPAPMPSSAIRKANDKGSGRPVSVAPASAPTAASAAPTRPPVSKKEALFGTRE